MKLLEDIVQLSRTQHGLVGYRQLLDLGFGHSGIRYRIDIGTFERLSDNVLRVNLAPETNLQRAMAAVLDAQVEAALSLIRRVPVLVSEFRSTSASCDPSARWQGRFGGRPCG